MIDHLGTGAPGYSPSPKPSWKMTNSISTGRKQDAWFVVDPETGETQMTLTTEGLSAARLYIGRTRESNPSCSSSWDAPLFICPDLVVAIQIESDQSVRHQ